MRLRVFIVLALMMGCLGISPPGYAALPANTPLTPDSKISDEKASEVIGNTSVINGNNVKSTQPQYPDKFSITEHANTHASDPNLPEFRDPHLPNEPVGYFKEKNDEFAKKMGYNPDWMDPYRDYAWLYEDNKKYMLEERKATWWDAKNMNPYVSYRQLNIDKLMNGLQVTEDGVYKGCNPNAIYAWYNTTGVMPVNWALYNDQIVADCNETYGVWRTRMVEDAKGTNFAGNHGEMDFTYGQVGPWGAPQHLWFTFNGKQYHGSGEAGWAVNPDPRSNGNDVYLVMTNTTPYWTPDECASIYQQAKVDEMSRNIRDPRNENFSTWSRVNEWNQKYEAWEKQNHIDKVVEPYTTRLKKYNIQITK